MEINLDSGWLNVQYTTDICQSYFTGLAINVEISKHFIWSVLRQLERVNESMRIASWMKWDHEVRNIHVAWFIDFCYGSTILLGVINFKHLPIKLHTFCHLMVYNCTDGFIFILEGSLIIHIYIMMVKFNNISIYYFLMTLFP